MQHADAAAAIGRSRGLGLQFKWLRHAASVSRGPRTTASAYPQPDLGRLQRLPNMSHEHGEGTAHFPL